MRSGDLLDGRYEMRGDGPLGSGGFGEVWKAYDRKFRREVAVKIMHAVGGAKDVERFVAEAITAGRLNHRHIVTVYEYGHTSHHGAALMYLVMELLRGTPADAVIDDGRPSMQQVLKWGSEVSAALATAHKYGVIHRDIKPANIIIQSTDEAPGEVKVVDFGISKDPDVPRQPTTKIIGSPPYMAPERFSAGGGDDRSDLYSLGCLLYALLTGGPPFEGSMFALIAQHAQEIPKAPSRLRHEVPAELDRLVLRLLAKAPEDRPGSAAEVRHQLLGMLEQLDRTERRAYTPTVRVPEHGFEPLYVAGDVHGYADDLRRALFARQLIDEDGHWSGGTARLRFLGNFAGQGPDGVGVIELVMQLTAEAAAAGGYCTALLGGQELLLLGASRYDEFQVAWLSSGGQRQDIERLLDVHLQWMSRLEAMVLTDNQLLLSTESTGYLVYGDTIDEVNDTIREALARRDVDELWDMYARLSNGPSGPDAATELLRTFGGERIVHGQSPDLGVRPPGQPLVAKITP